VGWDQLTIAIDGCSHLAGIDASSAFYVGNADTTITGCRSVGGYVGGEGKLTIFNSGASETLITSLITRRTIIYVYLEVHPQRIVALTASRSMKSEDGSAKLQCNSASPIIYTIVKNSDGSCRLGAGTYIDLQRMGAGAVTVAAAVGVTVKSRNSLLSVNGVNAVARLVCDGTDTWTLSGDLV
jgi:hypothetical protein